jgi:hypothetical protein
MAGICGPGELQFTVASGCEHPRLGCWVRALACTRVRRRSGPWRRFSRGGAMPARSIRSLPFRLSCPGLPHVEIVSAPTMSHELNSWSVVRCRMGVVRSRLGVVCLQPMPSGHVVEDPLPGGLVRSRSPRPSCRWRRSRVDDGVISRGRDAAGRRHHGDRRTRAGQAARSAARRRPAAPSSSCGLVRSTGDRFVSPWVPVLVWRNTSAPGAKLTVEEVDLRQASRVRSSRRPDEINPLASPAPKPTDVTCSSIST